ncbi:MAG: GtrA family protein [Micrococcales bacterium]|nr:GtrA family protein [Micrococcales bacterium]
MRGLLRQAASFLGVGGIGFLVDIAIFNLLRATVFDPQHVAGGAILAKAVSTLAAIAVNWIGNRQVTFRRERGARLGREALRFLAASLLGSSVSLACLAISHYALGFTSPAADNLSANVLGLALGTALRFQLYRTWVFPAPAVGAWDPARSRVPTSIP